MMLSKNRLGLMQYFSCCLYKILYTHWSWKLWQNTKKLGIKNLSFVGPSARVGITFLITLNMLLVSILSIMLRNTSLKKSDGIDEDVYSCSEINSNTRLVTFLELMQNRMSIVSFSLSFNITIFSSAFNLSSALFSILLIPIYLCTFFVLSL